MDHFAGLDVSVKETSVCIVNDTGRIVREVKVAMTDAPIRDRLNLRVVNVVLLALVAKLVRRRAISMRRRQNSAFDDKRAQIDEDSCNARPDHTLCHIRKSSKGESDLLHRRMSDMKLDCKS